MGDEIDKDHFFRHEAGRIVSLLTKIFGVGNLQLAEEMVQETLLQAFNQWTFGSIWDAVIGELHRRAGSMDEARYHFELALASAPTEAERGLLKHRLASLGDPS